MRPFKKKNVFLWIRNARRITFLVVQWLRLCTPNTESTGLIPGWGTQIPHDSW